MKKPVTISFGLFLFLFGLAYAKAMKHTPNDEKRVTRLPATAGAVRAE